jgi:hypothetical protein
MGTLNVHSVLGKGESGHSQWNLLHIKNTLFSNYHSKIPSLLYAQISACQLLNDKCTLRQTAWYYWLRHLYRVFLESSGIKISSGSGKRPVVNSSQHSKKTFRCFHEQLRICVAEQLLGFSRGTQLHGVHKFCNYEITGFRRNTTEFSMCSD